MKEEKSNVVRSKHSPGEPPPLTYELEAAVTSVGIALPTC